MFYRKILKQSLEINWRNKYLWFFGLFAVLLGAGGEYEVLFRGLTGDMNQGFLQSAGRIIQTGLFSKSALTNIGFLIANDAAHFAILLLAGLIILALFCFLVFTAIVSQAAIVNNSAAIIKGKHKAKLGVKDGALSGIKNFWPVFGLNAIAKLAVFLAFFFVSLPVILTANQAAAPIANSVYFIIFIILIPLAIVFSFIIKYAVAYVVISGSGFKASIKNGWELFVKNWLVSVEMAFILFMINLLAGLALGLAILTLAIPFVLMAFIFYKFFAAVGFGLIVVLGFIFILLAIILTGACLASFQISSWTSLFIALAGKGGTSKIARMAERVRRKI
ncbi:hypothetical protein KKC83_01830 [Patescibacteria group bacterium]|nr:hypothetical protein [Candidatus Falkowbacteria bacterium]MBU3905580.1 hypothetical protein [Patescibacteria group bacterium]MCG2698772.1 hypothetical protein [Candidatus Parcubacteria bacterium]MBU4014792.1 hypothetical protein [Patescibacteria group bacterium]MBU4026265.1 hypothetical protein [Patescibacteria group bacterium]